MFESGSKDGYSVVFFNTRKVADTTNIYFVIMHT